MSRGHFDIAEQDLMRARTLGENSAYHAAKAAVLASLGEMNYWIAVSEWMMKNPRPRLMQSLKNYGEALSLMRVVGDRSREIGVPTNSGLVYDAMGKPKDALAFYLQSLEKMEELQTLARLEEFRANFANQSAGLYGRAIQLEVEAHQTEAAFALSERARARLLLDQLGNTRFDDSKRASSEFLAREEQLRHENVILERQLDQESARPGPEMNSERIATLQSRLLAVRTSYEALLSQLKQSNVTYVSLLSTSPITLTEAQQRIDSDTTIVSYFTTSDTTFAFVLTKNSFQATKLHVNAGDLDRDIAVFRDFSGEKSVSPSLQTLYQSLIAPIRSGLKTNKLVVIPYGVLHDLPFAALTPDGHHFLCDEHAISYLPSVSVLSYLHSKEKPGGGRALVLANGQEEGLPRLNDAFDEARAVASILGVEPMVGKDARASVLHQDAANYAILHLVGHFEIDQKNPTASNIVLGRGEKDDSPLDLVSV